ncbi:hypothetical protein AX16_004506 [Volvariella volvacea WC 439]|nr:hypothetical protein AX16_004506 [Volvariella volvacea WC 439]
MTPSTTAQRFVSLEDCPPDIVHYIAIFSELSALRSLRLVSRTVHSLVSPIALRKVGLRFTSGSDTISICDDETDLGLTNLYQHARSLSSYLSPYSPIDKDHLPKLWRTIEKFRALRALKMEWEICDGDKTDEQNRAVLELQDPILSSVLKATGGTLESLTIAPHGWGYPKFANIAFPLMLLNVRGLKNLVFFHSQFGWRCDCRERGNNYERRMDEISRLEGRDIGKNCLPPEFKRCVKEIIKANPGIKELTIRQGCAARYFHPADLFDEQEPGFRLDHLDIRGVSFPQPSEPTFLEVFKNLTDFRADTPMSDINLNNLWKTLLHAGSQSLISLATSQVSPSFITFLRSFSGLRTLKLTSLEPENETPMPQLAHEFFTSALASHASTLQHLSITFKDDVGHIPGWAFTASQWTPFLSRLPALKSLGLYPAPRSTRYNSSESDVIEDYQAILDCVSQVYGGNTAQASFESLEIHWPESTFGCGTAYISWLDSVQDLLENKVVGGLRSGTGVPGRLIVKNGEYTAVERADGVWGYELEMSFRFKI